jgi:hypothetical protein
MPYQKQPDNTPQNDSISINRRREFQGLHCGPMPSKQYQCVADMLAPYSTGKWLTLLLAK